MKGPPGAVFQGALSECAIGTVSSFFLADQRSPDDRELGKVQILGPTHPSRDGPAVKVDK